MEQASGNFPLYSAQFFYIMVDIRAQIKLMPITIVFFWLEGHQLQRHGQQS